MTKFASRLDYLPCVVFLLLALFLVARLAIGAFPSHPLVWQAYIALAPAWREIAAFMPAGVWTSMTAIFGLLCLAGWAFVGSVKNWRRTHFVTSHLALLAMIFGMSDERVFSASVGGVSPTSTWPIPDFSHADLVMVGFLVATAIVCLQAHRGVIWALRHPERKVQ